MTNTNTQVNSTTNNATSGEVSFLRMLKVLSRLAHLGMKVSLKLEDGDEVINGTFYETGLDFCIYLPTDAPVTEDYVWAIDLEEVSAEEEDTVEYIFTNLILNVFSSVDEEFELENEEE